MPNYEFQCQKCRKKYSLYLSVKDREERKYKCPKCGSKKSSARVRRLFRQNFQKELVPHKGGLPFPDFIQPSDQGFGSEDGEGFFSFPSFWFSF